MNTQVIVRSHSQKPATRSTSSVVPSGSVEIGIVLDQSGSMLPSVSEVITGYNTLLEEQRALSKKTRVSLTLFDSAVRDLYQGNDISSTPPLTVETYRPSGGTALYDGIMANVAGLAARVDTATDSPRVVVAILSDGAENASVRHTAAEVKDTICYRQNQCGWQFLFLGPHASKTAYMLGIPVSHALGITASREGIRQALGRLRDALTNIQLGNTTDVFRLK